MVHYYNGLYHTVLVVSDFDVGTPECHYQTCLWGTGSLVVGNYYNYQLEFAAGSFLLVVVGTGRMVVDYMVQRTVVVGID